MSMTTLPDVEVAPQRKAPAATLASSIYDALREAILRGKLLPGQRLRVRDLAEEYGVGLSPVREALNRLAADDLVSQEDLRGFAVAGISVDDLRELTETRERITDLVLRLAMERGSTEWEERVLLAYHRMTRVGKEPQNKEADRAEWERLHRLFHMAIAEACGSRYLVEFYSYLFDRAERYRNLAIGHQAEDLEDEHKAIMEAVVARDTEQAIKLLCDHSRHQVDMFPPEFLSGKPKRQPRRAAAAA